MEKMEVHSSKAFEAIFNSRIENDDNNNTNSLPNRKQTTPINRNRSTTITTTNDLNLNSNYFNSSKNHYSNHNSNNNSNNGSNHLNNRSQSQSQFHSDHLDLLQVIDPAVQSASTLTHIQNSLLIPPIINRFGTPIIQLESNNKTTTATTTKTDSPSTAATDSNVKSTTNNNNNTIKSSISITKENQININQPEIDHLDQHLISILSDNPNQNQNKSKILNLSIIRRHFRGICAFLITPAGFVFTIYGFLVVFWGAALALILLRWIRFESTHQYRIWVEICSQILNALFTIPGLGLFPSRIIDWWNISIILRYARVIWKRKGRKNLEDPNELLPQPDTDAAAGSTTKRAKQEEDEEEKKVEVGGGDKKKTTNPIDESLPTSVGEDHITKEEKRIKLIENKQQKIEDQREIDDDEENNNNNRSSFEDVWIDDQELVLTDSEILQLRNAQSKLCRSQTWYRPFSSATHYAFPIRWAVLIMILNLGNSVFQLGLCVVMWGLSYNNRPAWTTATFMALSFSCGITSALLIWRIGLKTSKSKKVLKVVKQALKSTKKDKFINRVQPTVNGSSSRMSIQIMNKIKEDIFKSKTNQNQQKEKEKERRRTTQGDESIGKNSCSSLNRPMRNDSTHSVNQDDDGLHHSKNHLVLPAASPDDHLALPLDLSAVPSSSLVRLDSPLPPS